MAAAKRRLGLTIGAILLAGLAIALVATRHLTRLRLVPGDQVEVDDDVVYVEGSDHPKHRLDVYRAPGGGPVVHFVHGGYWSAGDKDYLEWATGLYGSVGRALARRGVTTVVQNYRLSPEVTVDAMIEDVSAALRWTRTHLGERIVVMGHSAGGHLASIAAVDRRPDAVPIAGLVALSAVFDVADMEANKDEAFDAEVTRPVFGSDRTRYDAYSPIRRFHAGTPPSLVVYGEHDTPYLIPQARSAVRELERLGRPSSLYEVPGATHRDVVLRFGAWGDDLTDRVVEFATRLPGD